MVGQIHAATGARSALAAASRPRAVGAPPDPERDIERRGEEGRGCTSLSSPDLGHVGHPYTIAAPANIVGTSPDSAGTPYPSSSRSTGVTDTMGSCAEPDLAIGGVLTIVASSHHRGSSQGVAERAEGEGE
jgi:hypothetical protein